MWYEQFPDFLRDKDQRFHIPELDNLVRLAISNLHIPSHRRHKHASDCFYVRRDTMRRYFGKEFTCLLADTDLIKIMGDYSRPDAATYPYQVTQTFRHLLVEFAKDKRSDFALNNFINHAPLKKPMARAIASRDSRVGNSMRATRCQIPAFVEVTLDWPNTTQEKYEEWLNDAEQDPVTRINRYGSESKPSTLVAETLQFASQLIRDREDNERVGIVQNYIESGSGRLYADGWSLQHCPTDLRRAILTNHTEWDFEACHPTILAGKATGYGMEAATLRFYIANRAAVRGNISNDTGVALKDVKTAFNAVMYGAKVTPYERGSLLMTLGQSGYDALTNHDFFRAIVSEMEDIKAELFAEFSQKRGIKNPLGKLKPYNEIKNKNSAVSHIVQGFEAYMLDTVICALTEEGEDASEVKLLQHDGWTTKESALPRLAGALDKIEAATGIAISVDHEKLTP
jgi:hypothetical protein